VKWIKLKAVLYKNVVATPRIAWRFMIGFSLKNRERYYAKSLIVLCKLFFLVYFDFVMYLIVRKV